MGRRVHLDEPVPLRVCIDELIAEMAAAAPPLRPETRDLVSDAFGAVKRNRRHEAR